MRPLASSPTRPARTPPMLASPSRTEAGRARSSSRSSSSLARALPSTLTSRECLSSRTRCSSPRLPRWTSPSRTSTPPRSPSQTCPTTSTRTQPRSSLASARTAKSLTPSSRIPPPPTLRCARSLRLCVLTRAPSCSTPSSTRACSRAATRELARSLSACATPWAGPQPLVLWTTSSTRMPTMCSSRTPRCRSASSTPTPTLSATW
mmetsp:Transcript_3880/g.10925  ORF Transcript_3880/g.10925 Transcript_3880/m.10925 type:complete len:206 (-) Transcript_3880:597-1214(-)